MRIQGVHTPGELKNYIINGAFDFWQEKGSTTTTVNTAATFASYISDMFLGISFGPTSKNFSYVRSTDVPTNAQSGFTAPYSMLRTTLTAFPTYAAADYIDAFQYRMEGLDYAKIHGKLITIGFWMKASVTGAYSISITNATESRSYVTTVNQNISNAWEYKSVKVQLETPDTGYSFGNLTGITIRIGSVTGTTNSTSTLNAWQSGAYYASTTSVNHPGTINSTVQITQVSLTEGSQGYGATGFQRAGKTIAQELAMCQRYYEKSWDLDSIPGTPVTLGLEAFVAATAFNRSTVVFRVTKRVDPSVRIYGKSGTPDVAERDSGTTVGSYSFSTWQQGFTAQSNGHTTAGEYTYNWYADARL